MKRLSQRLIAAVVVGLVALPAVAAAQRKLIAPFRGDAEVEITKPNTRLVGNEVITTILVKSNASGPLAGFRVEENWYDRAGTPVGGDTYRHPRPLPPNTVIEVTLRTPRRPNMQSNQYQFLHANGNIKTKIVPKLELPKEQD
ncbi:MAG: hypothetical protein AB1635_17505 [Acidobacteriota bacterium]